MPKYHKSRNPINTTPFFNRRTNMPSQRRLKVLGLLIFVALITLLYYSTRSSPSSLSSSSTSDFYTKTKDALDAKGIAADKAAAISKGKKAEGAKERSERLREAEAKAKTQANKKSPKPDSPEEVVGVGNSADAGGTKEGGKEKGVAGRKKYTVGGAGEGQEVIKDGEEKGKEEDEVVETPERRAARTELGRLLKKAPIIIFSKSYCPHSARAKRILLDEYEIEPAPYVVELDQHEIGADLQSLLAERTGRRTVPNVLINGVSIGGGDDVAALADAGTLSSKISDLAAKKILKAEVRATVEKKVVKEEGGHEAHQGHGLR